MQNLKHNTYAWLGGGIAIALLVAGALFFLGPKAAVAPTGGVATSTNATTTTVTLGNATITVPAGAIVKEVSGGTPQPPSLTGPILITPSENAQADQILRNDEETVIAQLKQAPTRVDLWLQLGVYRKMAQDYAGAVAAWNYVAAAAPAGTAYVAYGNLGDLYMNFDKNYAKAVSSYKAAIALNPHVIDYYSALYILYRYDLNEPGNAADIVAAGLRANPGDPTLLSLESQLNNGQ